MLAGALRTVADREPGLLAVVAPRHPRRFDEAERALASAGLPVRRRSTAGDSPQPQLPAVLLLDSLGELAAIYRRADLVFVGGSLNGWGGHNVLEPALFGKAVVVGPTMQNFRSITDDLLRVGGLVQVQNTEELAAQLADLASDAAKRIAIGQAGRSQAESQRGASARATEEATRLYRDAMTRHSPPILATLALGPLSATWRTAARLRRAAYEAGLLRSRRLGVPVVSVGNLAVGGTGKTPTVAWIVEQLAAQGHASAVLTRGYGRTSGEPMRLFRCTENVNPQAVGDEPAMLARRFTTSAPNTVIGVGANRYAAGRAVEQRESVDFLILDDGFQHMRLHRSLNIVLLDASEPFDNGHTLPLGRLRESPDCLKSVDVALITRSSREYTYEALHAELRRANPKIRIVHSRMVASDLTDLQTGRPAAISKLQGEPIALFCGIGNPQSFFRQAREMGCNVVFERAYRDHHRYSRRDLEELSEAASSNSARAFLTTAKDTMNLLGLEPFPRPLYALGIDLEIDNGDELLQSVLALKDG